MGGTIVDKSNYPFLVSLQKNGMHYCAGTIISSYHILTAAHCCFKGDELTTPIDIDDTAVVLGETNLSQCQDQIQKLTNVRCENIEIDKIVVHPEYSPFKMINDLAIIYTKTPMLNLSIMISEFDQSFSNSSRLMIAGWGFTNEFDTINNDRILHETPTYVTNISECASLGLELNEPRNQWCIGRGDGHSSCQGDSGGPLIQQELEESYSKTSLIGVTSFGPTNSCGKVWKRSVFTIVYNYKDWILEHSRIQKDKLASHSSKLQINSALLILLIILKLFGMLFITI